MTLDQEMTVEDMIMLSLDPDVAALVRQLRGRHDYCRERFILTIALPISCETMKDLPNTNALCALLKHMMNDSLEAACSEVWKKQNKRGGQ